MAKKKRMTIKEKQHRAELKKDMQERGILPPDKPRLNRKKFVEDARSEWNNRTSDCLIWDMYLYEAISVMIGHCDKNLRVSPEAVGVAKCLKLAMRIKEFHEKNKAEGKKEYKVGEFYEYIKDILEA